MRLVLVHGINQQNKDPEVLKAEWKNWLRTSFADPSLIDRIKIAMPYYGDILHDLMLERKSKAAAVQGADDANANSDEDAFIAAAMEEAVREAGATSRDIAIEERAEGAIAAEQGFFSMNRRVNALGRLIERLSPAHGRFVLPLVKQAYAYLKKPGSMRLSTRK